ncbi:uncharacterized protein ARMOST_03668 [Armillaria ostoyae]|uniref:Uncharacterized protein n=1 Tax=Armillaria ostoyae TaxID=47428 RepID=A0A284QV31_ARMOS|nr:uncharacterized protein ARMOST_03668 [Armillaria ostoyae]
MYQISPDGPTYPFSSPKSDTLDGNVGTPRSLAMTWATLELLGVCSACHWHVQIHYRMTRETYWSVFWRFTGNGINYVPVGPP